MHGNEVENSRGYRFRLVSSLPHLKSLDFSALTIVEKDRAQTCNIVDSFSIDVPAFRLANVTVSLLQGAEEQERGGKKAAREPRSVVTCETLLYPVLVSRLRRLQRLERYSKDLALAVRFLAAVGDMALLAL